MYSTMPVYVNSHVLRSKRGWGVSFSEGSAPFLILCWYKDHHYAKGKNLYIEYCKEKIYEE